MRITRRSLLGAGIVTLGAGAYVHRATRPTTEAPDSYHGPDTYEEEGPGQGGQGNCRTPEVLAKFDRVGSGLLGYEISGNLTPMRADPRFIELLDGWAADWADLSGLGPITELWSYGAYTDKCNSYHQAGRALDIARVVHSGGIVSCRFDQWAPGTATELRDYWRLAASLHAHFTYVLTHRYNAQHYNHIHIDNSVSNNGPSTFDSESRVQVQLVQASLQHVHGQEIQPTAVWDSQTQAVLEPVLSRLGITSSLTERDGWQGYLRATAGQ